MVSFKEQVRKRVLKCGTPKPFRDFLNPKHQTWRQLLLQSENSSTAHVFQGLPAGIRLYGFRDFGNAGLCVKVFKQVRRSWEGPTSLASTRLELSGYCLGVACFGVLALRLFGLKGVIREPKP